MVDMPYKEVNIKTINNITTIEYVPDPADPVLTEQQIRFRINLGMIFNALSHAEECKTKNHFIDQIAELARRTLIGDGRAIGTVEIELEELEEKVLNFVGVTRNKLLLSVIIKSWPIIAIGIIILTLFGTSFFIWDKIILQLPPPSEESIGVGDLELLRSYLGAVGFSFLGLYLGIIVSTMIRARGDVNEALKLLNFHGYGVGLYNVYLVTILVTFLILLAFDAVQVGLGGILLNEFDQNPILGLLVGAVCAVGEGPIATLLERVLASPEDKGRKPK